MKSFLFLVSRYPKGENGILEKDFIKKISSMGNNVKVICPVEDTNTELYKDGKIEVLYVNTLKYTGDINRFKKGIAVITRPFFFQKEIKKYFKKEKIDYIIGYTPFMAEPNLIAKLKKMYNAKTLLFLWDIFPQNAKDLGMMDNKLIFKFFKRKEEKMYEVFDKIICNCQGQIEYILKNNYKRKKDLVIIRNSEDEKNYNDKICDKNKTREEFGYNSRDIIGIFGGNMGIPQQLENLIYMIERLREKKDLKFIFVGTGAESNKIKKVVEDLKLKNIKILDMVERNQYEKILNMSDIALISLNKNYTVPNFPAKVTGYIKNNIPIFASLDNKSKKYLGDFLEENNVGVVAEAGNIIAMKEKYEDMVLKLEGYNQENFKKVYRDNFTLDLAYKILEKEIIKEGE